MIHCKVTVVKCEECNLINTAVTDCNTETVNLDSHCGQIFCPAFRDLCANSSACVIHCRHHRIPGFSARRRRHSEWHTWILVTQFFQPISGIRHYDSPHHILGQRRPFICTLPLAFITILAKCRFFIVRCSLSFMSIYLVIMHNYCIFIYY